jgi:sucrose phosphorylase
LVGTNEVQDTIQISTHVRFFMTVKNKVQLITYPDSLGGDLKRLSQVLDQYFPNTFGGGIHILPPFPSSGDRGFAPLTYMEIDPKFGSWEDIRKIGEKSPILLDLIINHISSKSSYFQDYLHNGCNSAYADLFIPIEKYWPDMNPRREEIEKIFLRRQNPFSDYLIQETREIKTLWTTFGKATPSEQVDIDVESKVARELITECLSNFRKNNVKLVRLDAVGYVIKRIGTSCFFVEPEIYQFLDWLKGIADSFDIELLPELHADFSTQLSLSEKGYWIYDFILPYMVLEALISKNSKKLKEYLAIRPHRQFTMLDCHDGIPVKPDLDGLFEMESAKNLVQTCLQRGGNLSRIFSPRFKDTDGFDVHQIRGTYYSMLGCDNAAYLVARALQFFVPGIPQVYYVGLLAGKNDDVDASRTADGREINRHNYSIQEIDQEAQRPVVRNLIKLIRFRNSHPAFSGNFSLYSCSDNEISISWDDINCNTRLHIDLQSNAMEIKYKDDLSGREKMLSLV